MESEMGETDIILAMVKAQYLAMEAAELSADLAVQWRGEVSDPEAAKKTFRKLEDRMSDIRKLIYAAEIASDDAAILAEDAIQPDPDEEPICWDANAEHRTLYASGGSVVG